MKRKRLFIRTICVLEWRRKSGHSFSLCTLQPLHAPRQSFTLSPECYCGFLPQTNGDILFTVTRSTNIDLSRRNKQRREHKDRRSNVRITLHVTHFYFNPFRPALNCFSHCFYALTDEKYQIYKLRACRSAIFERNCENVCKPLDILTRFYECLLYPRSAIFEKS